MKISTNNVVSLSYKLSVTGEDGEQVLIETADAENPMVILFGMSGLPEKFEQNIEGLTVGDSFNFSMSADEAYGPVDQEAFVELPKNIFEIEGKIDEEMLTIGNFLPMQDNEGNFMQGKVLEIHEDTVLMDFNHPLAGKTMHFDGEVLNIREASTEEIEHGHVHGEGGHHH